MKNSPKPSIVIDTNVWLSGLIFGGQPGRLIRMFAEGQLLVVISEELLTELRRIINEKFPGYLSHLDLLEDSIRQGAELVKLGSRKVAVSRDSDDNKVIETALIGKCQYIVSGDNDLLVLRKHGGIKILKPVDFLRLFTM